MRLPIIVMLPLVIWLFFCPKMEAQLAQMNGFDLYNSLIPTKDIHYGGPPKDGIPSIDRPLFIDPINADFLRENDLVLGLEINGTARAYPIRILNYHEIVNDIFGTEPVVITYCPLCGSGMAFSSKLNNDRVTFGVSGLLYNSDVLMYDRQSNSLWSQLESKAISGKYAGTELTVLALEQMTWKEWKLLHPKTKVLSTKTGHKRNYNKTPYEGYEQSSRLMFPVNHKSGKFHNKEKVLGIEVAGQFKAFPFSRLRKTKQKIIEDRFANRTFYIHYNKKDRTARITDESGNTFPSVTAYWFAWKAFHPETQIFKRR